MKTFVVIGVAVVAALNSAWIAEGASSNCAAIEHLAMRITEPANPDNSANMLVKGVMALSNGRIVEQTMAEAVPGVPTSVSCAFRYWQVHNQLK